MTSSCITADTIKRVYTAGAAHYESAMAQYWEFDRKSVVDSLGLTPGRRVLELGVGTGKNLCFYPPHVDVVGIDFTRGMLDLARAKMRQVGNDLKITLAEMDAEQMTFGEDEFDAALETFMLCVTPDPAKVLREVVRVTKRDAPLVIFDYCKSQKPEIVKWQELIADQARSVGFPPDVIIWDPLRDYEEIIRDNDLALEILMTERHEDENPFLMCCTMLLRNAKG